MSSPKFRFATESRPRGSPASRRSSTQSAAELAKLLGHAGLAFAQMAAATGDGARGEKGLAALPGREAEFRDGFRQALDYAEAVGCPFIHPMAGVADGNSSRATES